MAILQKNKRKFICLASKSKSRRKLLEGAKIRHEIRPADIDETFADNSPSEFVLRLAKSKAHTVSNKTKADLVVAADSVAVFNGNIFGKPLNRENAIEIITKLQGQTHYFFTGLCVIKTSSSEELIRLVTTEVKISPMTYQQISSYVDTFKPYSFAGAYDNSISSWFIEETKGSYSNLMGLPMVDLRLMIEELGYNWFDFVDSNENV